MDFQQLINVIKEAGIVGAGGAGFPLHAKLNRKSDYIVVNGAECEPLLYVDQHLMNKYAKELLEALDIIIKLTGAKTGIIGLKGKHTKVVESLKLASANYDCIEVRELKNIYPVGDELTLIYECIGKVVPMGSLPTAQKVTVLNVETLLNVWHALYQEQPVTHTYVTIGGDLPKPATLKVPVGMKIQELIALGGRDDLAHHTIIMGGPMTGNIVSPSDVVTKTTTGLIILKDDHYVVQRKAPTDFNSLKKIMSSCSQCRMCTDLCPRNLLGHKVEPHKLMNAVANGLINHSEACQTALGCSGCNLCSLYACHHDLDPAGFMTKIKGELINHGIKVKDQKESVPDSWMEYRQVPSASLIKKLGLTPYKMESPLIERNIRPKVVEIPLKQHIGSKALPCVAVGEDVCTGQLIGKIPADTLGANVHASISGRVKSITKEMILIERGM